jgi:hypothetical protein
MNATAQRDKVIALARSKSDEALMLARTIEDPWFRAQALSHGARYAQPDPRRIAQEAEAAALECDDDFKRSAVRAWEIAALAERGCVDDARKSLRLAVYDAMRATPPSSRCESLSLLLHAAARISVDDARAVAEKLRDTTGEHWRCDRAVVDATGVLAGLNPDVATAFANSVKEVGTRRKCQAQLESGGTSPRPFYW